MVVRSRSDAPLLGILLVMLGVMYLVEKADLFGYDGEVVGVYWPVLLMTWGAWGLVARPMRARLFSVIVLALGVTFLAFNLNKGSWGDIWAIWPLLLILLGLYLLFRRRGGPASRPGDPDALDESWTFGGGQRAVTSQAFKGGRFSAFMGGGSFDLSRAALADGKATLDVDITFGGLELKVPDDWAVDFKARAVFGGFGDERKGKPTGPQTKVLTITGSVNFGGVSVKSL